MLSSPSAIFGMDEFQDRLRAEFIHGEAKGWAPNRVQLDEVVVEARNGEKVEREGEETITFGFSFETVLNGGELPLMFLFRNPSQLFRLFFDQFGAAVKLDKD